MKFIRFHFFTWYKSKHPLKRKNIALISQADSGFRVRVDIDSGFRLRVQTQGLNSRFILRVQTQSSDSELILTQCSDSKFRVRVQSQSSDSWFKLRAQTKFYSLLTSCLSRNQGWSFVWLNSDMLLCLFYCLDRCIITAYRVCLCWSDGQQRHNNTATMYSFRHPVRSADKGYSSRWSLIIKTDQNNIILHVCLAMPSMPNKYEYNMHLQSYLQYTWIRVVFLLWIQ